jgi:hypothetical protein
MEWSPPDWLLNSTAALVVLSLVGLLIRMVGPWRQQITQTEEKLRQELRDERMHCERELRLVRHRERGGRQIIYSLLHLFNMPSGEKREGALEVIHATLSEMERVEAMEAGLGAAMGGWDTGEDE